MEQQPTYKTLSVCLPTYKGVNVIGPTLDCLLSQSHTDFEIIIGNDSPVDSEEMKKLVASYNDSRIVLRANEKNLGYPTNIKRVVANAKNEILFFMCQDDRLLDCDLFKKVLEVFNNHPDVGVITRPYYWFTSDPQKPNRYIPKCEKRIISLQDEPKYVRAMMDTVGQLSGLVFRKSLIKHNFGDHVFCAHAYPFYSIMRTHSCYYWPDFMVAVWTAQSQTKHVSSIYSPAPTWSWVHMFETVLPEEKFKCAREVGVNLFGGNVLGLVQIKNYGRYRDLFPDIYYLIKARKRNVLDPKFWLIVLGILVIPRRILVMMVDFYHNVITQYRLRRLLL